MSTWNQALEVLINAAPRLAYKSELIEALRVSSTQSTPPSQLMQQMEVILAISKQNERVADLHGYEGLLQASRTVSAAATDVILALKATGAKSTNSEQIRLT